MGATVGMLDAGPVGTLVADVGAVVIDTGCRHPIVGGLSTGGKVDGFFRNGFASVVLAGGW
ncbi:hypothetical protein ABFG05_004566 [Salmonella enterica]|nr:hypothetical protein [Salmonella enterica subsp. enterica serovar Stanley]